jgi:hypothetical protein
MCEGLLQIERAMGAYAGDFDAALLVPDDLGEVVRSAGAIEKMAAAVSALAAARIAGGAGLGAPEPRTAGLGWAAAGASLAKRKAVAERFSSRLGPADA